jgi:hypothetical protein
MPQFRTKIANTVDKTVNKLMSQNGNRTFAKNNKTPASIESDEDLYNLRIVSSCLL